MNPLFLKSKQISHLQHDQSVLVIPSSLHFRMNCYQLYLLQQNLNQDPHLLFYLPSSGYSVAFLLQSNNCKSGFDFPDFSLGRNVDPVELLATMVARKCFRQFNLLDWQDFVLIGI